MLAASNGQVGILRLLLGAGADATLADVGQNTAAHYAAFNGRVDVLAALAELRALGADAVNGRGRSALHVALERREELAAKVLLDWHADAGMKDESGWTALHLASFRCSSYAVSSILSTGGVQAVNSLTDNQETALILACSANNTSTAGVLLAQPSLDVTLRDANGMTALHYAAYRHDNVAMFVCLLHSYTYIITCLHSTYVHARRAMPTDFLGSLLEAGADPNAVAEGVRGCTPLLLAVQANRPGAARRLLDDSRTDPNLVDSWGQTGLHWAASGRLHDIGIELLTHERTDVNAQDVDGITPLIAACQAYWVHLDDYL